MGKGNWSYVKRRYVCVAVDHNGYSSLEEAPSDERALPFSFYPIQISIDIVEDGVARHAYDSLIRGATQLTPNVRENAPASISTIQREGKELREVLADWKALLRVDDLIVVDSSGALDELRRAAQKLAIEREAEFFDMFAYIDAGTLRSEAIWRMQRHVGFEELCQHFQATLAPKDACR